MEQQPGAGLQLPHDNLGRSDEVRTQPRTDAAVKTPTNQKIYLVIDLSFEFPIPRMKKARLFANKKKYFQKFDKYACILLESRAYEQEHLINMLAY